MKPWLANLLLVLTAFLWGSTFVAQKMAMNASLGPFAYNAARMLVGAVALFPIARWLSKRVKAPVIDKTVVGGIWCGVVLFAAASFQQVGIVGTDAGKTGFITALYIVLVPILGLALGRKVRPAGWVSVALATAGMYLLCIRTATAIETSDLLVLVCAVLYAVHILVIAHFAPISRPVTMSMIQFIVAGVLSAIVALLFESGFHVADLMPSLGAILYAGILSSAVAYTLQIVAQRHIPPTIAALVMSLEAVFAVVCGALFLGETFSSRELSGIAFMGVAIVLSQITPAANKAR